MISHFSLTAFVRSVSDDLLIEYFNRADTPLSLDPKTPKKRRVAAIMDAIGRLDDDRRAWFECNFREVHGLATAAGVRAIIDEATFQGVDLGALLRQLSGHLDKAFFAYLNALSIFDVASKLAVRATLPGRYWKRRLPVVGNTSIDPATKIDPLKRAISDYFLTEEGRGAACKIDYHVRRPLHHFFAYPEDYSSSPLVWSGADLGRRPIRPAFEVIFVYDEVAGCLDIYVEAGKQTVVRLRDIFARTVLGIEEQPEIERPAYAIECLKGTSVAFIRDPDSEITDVRIKRLGFRILDGTARKISVEAEPFRDASAIFSMLDRVFAQSADGSGRYQLSQARVISASLQATIDKHDGKKPRTRTFDLTEHSCSLKYEDTDLALRKLLSASGIDLTTQQKIESSGNALAQTA